MKFEMSSDEFKVFCAGLTKAESEEITTEGSVEPPFSKIGLTDLLAKLSEIMYLSNSGSKINAIKALRTLTNCGLKEAKDTVEGVYTKPTGFEAFR